MKKSIFEELNKASWNEWVQRCEITEEQLGKLKTKHTNYVVKPVADIDGTVIRLKYHIKFFQGKKETESMELKVYSIDTSKNEMLGGIIENWNILMMIMKKIDDYRGDGKKSKKPDYKDFLLMYEKLLDKADGKKAM